MWPPLKGLCCGMSVICTIQCLRLDNVQLFQVVQARGYLKAVLLPQNGAVDWPDDGALVRTQVQAFCSADRYVEGVSRAVHPGGEMGRGAVYNQQTH